MEFPDWKIQDRNIWTKSRRLQLLSTAVSKFACMLYKEKMGPAVQCTPTLQFKYKSFLSPHMFPGAPFPIRHRGGACSPTVKLACCRSSHLNSRHSLSTAMKPMSEWMIIYSPACDICGLEQQFSFLYLRLNGHGDDFNFTLITHALNGGTPVTETHAIVLWC